MMPDPAAAPQDSILGLAERIESWIALGQPGIVWTRYLSDLSRNVVLDKLSVGRDLPRLVFAPPSPEDAAVWLEDRLTEFASRPEPPAVVTVLFPFARPEDEANALWASFRNLNLRRERLARFSFVQLWWISSAISARAELEASDLVSWFKLRLWLNELPLTAASEEVDRLRIAAAEEPQRTPDLANAFTVLGLRFDELGHREQALQAAQESLALYRDLARQNPEAFLEPLAVAINNVAKGLRDLGREREAFALTEEATSLFRKLAEAKPELFLPELATSVGNLAINLRGLGRYAEALPRFQESTLIFRQLAATHPDAFLPSLAMSLNNVAVTLSDLDQQEAALEYAYEAVGVFRNLAVARPDAFLWGLARSLNTLANRLSEVGRRDESLAQAQEVVQIYRQLATERPKAYLPDLADSVSNLASRLGESGRTEEARARAEEAVNLFRALAVERPQVFSRGLASSLNNLANTLADLGLRLEATVCYEESLRLLTPKFLELPQANARVMQGLVKAYTSHLQAAGAQPKQELLQPVLDVLQRLTSPRSI